MTDINLLTKLLDNLTIDSIDDCIDSLQNLNIYDLSDDLPNNLINEFNNLSIDNDKIILLEKILKIMIARQQKRCGDLSITQNKIIDCY